MRIPATGRGERAGLGGGSHAGDTRAKQEIRVLASGSPAGHTEAVKSRPKLSGAPLAYTLAKVEGTADPYQAFGKSLWSDGRAVAATLKELVFLRSSIVNRCAT